MTAAAAKPKTLMAALLAFQDEAPTLQRTKINPAFKAKYVPLDKLVDATSPVLNKHGLLWITEPGGTHELPELRYRLVHVESSEEIAGTMPLLLSQHTPQGLGSALTYARRYALMTVLGLVASEDDDGKKAAKSNGGSKKGRLLTAAERRRVMDAVRVHHADDGVSMLLSAVGADSEEELTTDQAFELRKLLDEGSK